MFSANRSRRRDHVIAARPSVRELIDALEPRQMLSVAPPLAPTDVTATPDARTPVVRLTWTDQSSKERGFVVQRRRGRSGSWLTVATLPANTGYFRNTRLTEGTTYVYRVAAVNRGGSSAWVTSAPVLTFSPPSPRLDGDFNTSGDFTNDRADATRIATSPDGTVVYFVSNDDPDAQSGNLGPVIDAHFTTGTVPASFKAGPTAGRVQVNGVLPTGMASIAGLAVQPDGKVLVAGNATDANSSIAVARFNTDGTLDTSFNGGAGELVTHFGDKEVVADLALASNGAIYVGGGSHVGGTGPGQFYAVRLNADGTVDRSYGVNGISEGDPQGSSGHDVVTAAALAIDPTDGSVVVVGSHALLDNLSVAGPSTMVGTRLLADGSATDAFAGAANSTAGDVLVQSSGKIVVVGANSGIPATLRFNANGSADASWFGPGAIATPAGTSQGGGFRGITGLADGSLVLVGSVDDPAGNTDAVIGHVSGADGSLIDNFTVRPLINSTGISGAHYEAVTVAPDDSLFAGGSTRLSLQVTALLVSKYQLP